MTDGTRPETSAFIGPHYQPAAEADRPDFYPTVLDLVISFFQDEWIEIPRVGGGALRGSDVWRKLWGGGLGRGWVRVLLLMINSVFSFAQREQDNCFYLWRKVNFSKWNDCIRWVLEVDTVLCCSTQGEFWSTDHYKHLSLASETFDQDELHGLKYVPPKTELKSIIKNY